MRTIQIKDAPFAGVQENKVSLEDFIEQQKAELCAELDEFKKDKLHDNSRRWGSDWERDFSLWRGDACWDD